MLIHNNLQSLPYSFVSPFLERASEIPAKSLDLLCYIFLSRILFNTIVQLTDFERFTVQFQSYRAMIFISNMEVKNDEQ